MDIVSVEGALGRLGMEQTSNGRGETNTAEPHREEYLGILEAWKIWFSSTVPRALLPGVV